MPEKSPNASKVGLTVRRTDKTSSYTQNGNTNSCQRILTKRFSGIRGDYLRILICFCGWECKKAQGDAVGKKERKKDSPIFIRKPHVTINHGFGIRNIYLPL